MIDPEDLAMGSVVRLISGSPKLTVAQIGGVILANGRQTGVAIVRVVWFSARGELQEAELPSTLLTWPAAARPRIAEDV